MDNILGYITDNYISIVFFIVLILLAIIGYYAEKANNKKNSQGDQLNKVDHNTLLKEGNEFIESLETETKQKNDVMEKSELKVEQKNDKNIAILSEDIKNNLIKEEKNNELFPEEILSVDNNIQETREQINQVEENKTNEVIFNKEEINRFNEEFELILPKKEIIDSDLLSDIDDLELGRTQKIDLSVVPDLDNIELPKIKQMDKEEDIWKF